MSDQPKTGGPAFPNHRGQFEHMGPGMTLRDYLAAKALAAILTHRDIRDNVPEISTAKEAYSYADAMLAARSSP